MMKKKKLNINELKVKSFVTELQPEHAYTAKGGDDNCITLTSVGDWVQCVKIYYDVGPGSKENSWLPYDCGTQNPGGTGDPGEKMTFEYDSCPD